MRPPPRDIHECRIDLERDVCSDTILDDARNHPPIFVGARLLLKHRSNRKHLVKISFVLEYLIKNTSLGKPLLKIFEHPVYNLARISIFIYAVGIRKKIPFECGICGFVFEKCVLSYKSANSLCGMRAGMTQITRRYSRDIPKL